MATNPMSDPLRQLTAMMAQQVRHSQALASHVNRLVDIVGDLSKDLRTGQRSIQDRFDRHRDEISERFDRLRDEMNERFRAVGSRFDEVEERLIRLEDQMRDIRSDLIQMQNDVLNAQQSALQAHLRLDDLPGGGEEPSP